MKAPDLLEISSKFIDDYGEWIPYVIIVIIIAVVYLIWFR